MRAAAGVVVGYFVTAFAVVLTFFIAYSAMGADRAFEPGSFQASPAWVALSLVLSLAAALLGGWVCALIARTPTALYVLAGIILLLGFASAVPELAGRERTNLVRGAEISGMEAMMNARQPVWVALLNPIIGAAGVLLGGRLRRRT